SVCRTDRSAQGGRPCSRCGRHRASGGHAGKADPGQAGFAPSSARGGVGAAPPDPLGGAGPPASAPPPAPGGSGFEAAAVLPPPALVQVLRPDLVDHDLISAGTGGVLPPQAPGRGAGAGRKPCDAFGQFAGDGAVQLTAARVPLWLSLSERSSMNQVR